MLNTIVNKTTTATTIKQITCHRNMNDILFPKVAKHFGSSSKCLESNSRRNSPAILCREAITDCKHWVYLGYSDCLSAVP